METVTSFSKSFGTTLWGFLSSLIEFTCTTPRNGAPLHCKSTATTSWIKMWSVSMTESSLIWRFRTGGGGAQQGIFSNCLYQSDRFYFFVNPLNLHLILSLCLRF